MELLVFAEKPWDWKEIAKALSKDGSIKQNWKSFLEVDWFDGNRITIFWWAWHFYNLKTPKEIWIDPKIENLPLDINEIPLTEDYSFSSKRDMLKNAIELLNNPKFDLLVFSWDAGREWLAIMDRLYKMSGSKLRKEYIWKADCSKNEIRRLWAKRLTEHDSLASWESIIGLTEAANTRAVVDWKIWMNFSTFYSLYYRALNDEYIKFKVWWVMSPTLNIVNIRENEIKDFKKEKLYWISMELENWISTDYIFEWKDRKTKNRKLAEEKFIEIVNLKSLIVSDEVTKTNLIKPSYWLNGANIKIAKSIWTTPKRVLELIDEMYNKDGVLSYPRVESTFITDWEFEKIKNIILFLNDQKERIPPEYKRVIEYIVNNEFKLTIPVVNNNKVIEGHGAFHVKATKGEKSLSIILDLLNKEDKKALIFKRVLENNISFFLPSCEILSKKITFNWWWSTFITDIKSIKRLWHKILDPEFSKNYKKEKESIKKWDNLIIKWSNINESYTKPPSRISVDSIIAYMCHPKNIFTSSEGEEELYTILEKTEWIWQPATREQIVEKLINEKYVEVKKWLFYMTELGGKYLDTIDEELKNVLLRAEMEKQLNLLAQNYTPWKSAEILNNINNFVKSIITNSLSKELVEKINNFWKKITIKEKSPEWFELFLHKSKKNWSYYVASDNNKNERWRPMFFSMYDPIKQEFISKSICTTKNKCPTCSSDMNVFRSTKSDKLFIECNQRWRWACAFVAPYDINNDKIIVYNEKTSIACPSCGWNTLLRRSSKNKKYYAVCENNKQNDWWCDFIWEFDVKSNKLVAWDFSSIWVTLGWKMLLDRGNFFWSADWKVYIHKEICWKKIEVWLLKEIEINWWISTLIKDFISKKWKPFSARLQFKENRVSFLFN